MNKKDTDLKNLVVSINKGEVPVVDLVDKDPRLAAVLSKLVKDEVNVNRGHFNINEPQTKNTFDINNIESLSKNIKNRIKDNENIIKLFPDIELCVQILVSSILSPKDMIKSDLIFKNKNNSFVSDLSMVLNNKITSHLTEHYKIKEILPKMLREILFKTGSYVNIVIPESTLDKFINSKEASLESYSVALKEEKNIKLNILGPPSEMIGKNSVSLEGLNKSNNQYRFKPIKGKKLNSKQLNFNRIIGDLVEISDNYSLLTNNKNNTEMVSKKLQDVIKGKSSFNYSIESDGTSGLINKIYKSQGADQSNLEIIDPQISNIRKSIGRPLMLHVSSDSVIPVYYPNDPESHIGYFILTDSAINPLIRDSYGQVQGLDNLNKSGQNSGDGGDVTSMLIDKAKANLQKSNDDQVVENMSSVYANMVENELLERLKNGVYNDTVQISNNLEIYKVMLYRTLINKYTRLIYVPIELTTYFAFKYNKNGTGRSYLDDVSILCGLRAMMLFAKVMNLTKNSIPITKVNMTLDPHDPDPQKTIEVAANEIIRMRQQYFPLGINSPSDLVNWIQRAGYEFAFEGHPGIPETKFEFETKSMDHKLPEDDLEETLRKQTYMAFGLSPETVDNGFSSEFATTVVANNLLLSKRIIQIQGEFTPKLTDMIKKICIYDMDIMGDLKTILSNNESLLKASLTQQEASEFTSNKSEFLSKYLEDFINGLYVELPNPSSESGLSEAFSEYKDTLEKALDSWINEDVLTAEVYGERSESVAEVKEAVRHYFLRKWMAENGFMTELGEITATTNDGKPKLDLFAVTKHHNDGIIKSCMEYIESKMKNKEGDDEDTDDDEGGDDGDTSGDNEGDDNDDFGSDFGDDDGEFNDDEPEESDEEPVDEDKEPEEDDKEEESVEEDKDEDNKDEEKEKEEKEKAKEEEEKQKAKEEEEKQKEKEKKEDS